MTGSPVIIEQKVGWDKEKVCVGPKNSFDLMWVQAFKFQVDLGIPIGLLEKIQLKFDKDLGKKKENIFWQAILEVFQTENNYCY